MGITTVSRLLNTNEWVQWVEGILVSRERGTALPQENPAQMHPTGKRGYTVLDFED